MDIEEIKKRFDEAMSVRLPNPSDLHGSTFYTMFKVEVDTLFAELERERAEVRRLRDTLKMSVSIIKVWHNLDKTNVRPEMEAERMWRIYYENSPEMREIKALIEGKEKP